MVNIAFVRLLNIMLSITEQILLSHYSQKMATVFYFT